MVLLNVYCLINLEIVHFPVIGGFYGVDVLWFAGRRHLQRLPFEGAICHSVVGRHPKKPASCIVTGVTKALLPPVKISDIIEVTTNINFVLIHTARFPPKLEQLLSSFAMYARNILKD